MRGEYRVKIIYGTNGHGTTSACAENTGVAIYRVALWGNYLRVRGEYCRFPLVWFPTLELPPRARRIHFQAPCPTVRRGTTSACAENTRLLMVNRAKNWNYLRVRGEYPTAYADTNACSELPPRARRILPSAAAYTLSPGTTSACAENTTLLARRTNRARNYLRVRGEYARPRTSWPTPWGLPPRARRIRRGGIQYRGPLGTTSACAENTQPQDQRHLNQWNYLRVRGEYIYGWSSRGTFRELPPRARRIHHGS